MFLMFWINTETLNCGKSNGKDNNHKTFFLVRERYKYD